MHYGTPTSHALGGTQSASACAGSDRSDTPSTRIGLRSIAAAQNANIDPCSQARLYVDTVTPRLFTRSTVSRHLFGLMNETWIDAQGWTLLARCRSAINATEALGVML